MNWFDFIIQATAAPAWAAVFTLARFHRIVRWYLLREWLIIALANIFILSVFLLFRQHVLSGIAGAAFTALVAAILRWWDSGQPRRAARLLGAKARAIRDGMAKRMRQLAPRPVPVPS